MNKEFYNPKPVLNTTHRRGLLALRIFVLVGDGQNVDDHLNAGDAVANNFGALIRR